MKSQYTFRPTMLSIIKRNQLHSLSALREVIHGDLFSLDGVPILHDGQLESTRRLPIALNNHQTLHGDLIPSTSWGSSLANLLTKKSWDMLRHPVIERCNHVCSVCGTKHDVMDVHEIWSYGFPPEDEIKQCNRDDLICMGVQRLDGLIPLCKACHECFHLGFAKINNRLDIALQRIQVINQWNDDEIRHYYLAISSRFNEASRIHWMLDLSKIKHPEGGLTIKSPWRLDEQENKLLVSPSQYGGDLNVTMITGVPWRFAKEKEWRPIQDIE